MSSNLKQSLQKELFLNEERLLICIPTGKSRGATSGLGKKARQPSYLCITVTSEKPVHIRIHVIKKSERSGEAYKRKQSWLLSDLKCVDGKDSAKDSADFELVFEKPYKWVAESTEDRDAFIKLLWKLSWKHLERRAKFLNMQRVVDEVDLESSSSSQRGHQAPAGDALLSIAAGTAGESGDYQVLTVKEEADLTMLMKDCDFAISQANAFAEQLTRDLSALEGANIHSMMASEDSIAQLMELLDDGIERSTRIEDRLVNYELIIKSVKTQMEIMRDKDSMIRIQESNHEKLKVELGELVAKLDLRHDYQTALLGGDLATSRGVADCTAAAASLAACMKADIPKALASMSGVKEQQKLFDKLKGSFSRRLSHHLNNLFIHMGNVATSDTLSRAIVDYRLRSLQKHHRELVPYADLMTWLGTADAASFEQLKQVYLESFQKVYHKEIADYIENSQTRIPIIGVKRAGPSDLSGSSSSLQTMSHSESSLTDDRARHVQFGQVFSRVLSELSPICTEEQNFCMRFFSLAKDKAGDPQAEEKMLLSLFLRLDQDLQSFMNYSHKQDPYYSLCLLVQLSHHASRIDSSCFLVKILGNCLVTVKRNFDAFIKTLVQSFKDTKVNKKSRCGIISFVHDFEVFAEQAEMIFQGSDRRSDLDRAYKVLVETVFEEVNRIAMDHLKTPRNVVLMENYHHLFAVFSRLKIASLDSERKEAKQKKQDYMQAYVAEQLGQPMEKLNVFFEGAEAQINAGVKPEEVGYQLAFSKQELRRVIKEYSAREVKRSLDALYRKVEKHLCEEENLLQVVWRSMQEDFLKQYKHFEMMIAKCYGDSQITPEFTIDEVLQYFSEIAQSH